jgi:hypothetical protein
MVSLARSRKISHKAHKGHKEHKECTTYKKPTYFTNHHLFKNQVCRRRFPLPTLGCYKQHNFLSADRKILNCMCLSHRGFSNGLEYNFCCCFVGCNAFGTIYSRHNFSATLARMKQTFVALFTARYSHGIPGFKNHSSNRNHPPLANLPECMEESYRLQPLNNLQNP